MKDQEFFASRSCIEPRLILSEKFCKSTGSLADIQRSRQIGCFWQRRRSVQRLEGTKISDYFWENIYGEGCTEVTMVVGAICTMISWLLSSLKLVICLLNQMCSSCNLKKVTVHTIPSVN